MTEEKQTKQKPTRQRAKADGHRLLKQLTLGGIIYPKGDTITLRSDQVERLRQRGIIK